MSSTELVFGKENIDIKLKSLVKTDQYNVFKDKITNDHWLLTFYESEMLECDLGVLEKVPVNKCVDLIGKLIDSEDIQEVITICLIIYDRNFDDDKNNRLLLIESLENYYNICPRTEFALKKIRFTIYETELYDSINLEPILGKSYVEIESDSTFYKEISLRSKKLLEMCSVSDW